MSQLALLQPTVHGEERALARRDSGIAKAAESAGGAWAQLALAELRLFLAANPEFHVDAFADATQGRWQRKAFGAVVLRAVRLGWMEGTSEYRPSVASNNAPKRVFKSLLWRAP